MALGAAGARLFAGDVAEYDENLTVFLSDVHVTGDDGNRRWLFTRRELDARIAEILAMRPLPRRVVTFGDLAFGNGDPRDYKVVAPKFKLLRDVGIEVTHAMGNHDRRRTFLEFFPEQSATLVEGRIVSEVKMPTCDLILLDSLDEGKVSGALGEPQWAWLKETLAKRTRPTFVGAHHYPRDLTDADRGARLVTLLKNAPCVAGWINGHGHHWIKTPLVSWGARNEDAIRALQLPSGGLWGDIGSVTFRTSQAEAVATLDEKAYWFNDAPHPGERLPETWKAIVDENRGQFCRFPYARAQRNRRG